MCDLIIIGAGGHACVVADAALKAGFSLLGFLDDTVIEPVLGYPILGVTGDARKFSASFVVGIGDNTARKSIVEKNDLPWATIIHPSAIVGRDVTVGEGAVVMAGSIVNPRATIGPHCILNTGSIVEHDCALASYVHISPGAVLGGGVSVGALSHIAIGASVRNYTRVGSDCVIGAGACVVKDCLEPGVYTGVPARRRLS